MQEFKHSVKVPRNYKLAANILKKALTEGASVKTLVFQDKLKHFRTNVLYALISEAIKHNAEIEKLFEVTEILKNEPRLDVWLAKILAVELLFGKKDLPGQSKPEVTVASYKQKFQDHLADIPEQIKRKDVRRPRYVRVNTNLLTTSDAIRAFQDEGCRFVRCTSGSYEDYLEQVKQLGEYDFTQDYHVKTVFVFAPGTKLHEHPLYLESKIILQDKATAMAVHLLAPPPGSVVMDMCAAPGMKTTQLAAFMRNQGTVYAVERSAERYKVLCEFVEKTGSTCVKTLNKDVLEIKKGEYPDVEYVLLDPSCSGSGMDLCGHSYVEDARLARLTSLQEKFLKHAMNAFPNAKKIVYSTCSLFSQENERVVTNVVSQNRVKWNVLNVKELLKDQWNNVGTGMYGSMGTRCMYARPDSDLTTGFFLSVLEKDPKYSNSENSFKGIENFENKEKSLHIKNEVFAEETVYKKSKKNAEVNNDHDITNQDELVEDIRVDNNEDPSIKKKKKNKRAKVSVNCEEETEDTVNPTKSDINLGTSHKKRKKNKIALDENSSHEDTQMEAQETSEIVQTKKSKKKIECVNEVEGEVIFEAGSLVDRNSEVVKKKKKKTSQLLNENKCETEMEENRDIVNSAEINFEAIPKKMKKNILASDETLCSKNKMKKLKDDHTDHNENEKLSGEIDLNVSLSKKKKKSKHDKSKGEENEVHLDLAEDNIKNSKKDKKN